MNNKVDEESINIIVNRSELYLLIKNLEPDVDEGIKLTNSGFGNFHGHHFEWEWDLSQLDSLPIYKVFNFYQLVKQSI